MDRRAVKALESAMELLAESTIAQGDLETVEFKIWKAASEVEYASFILSLEYGLLDLMPKFGEAIPVGHDFEEAMAEARDAISQALSLVEASPKDAYIKAKLAAIMLRRAERMLTRNRGRDLPKGGPGA